MQIPCNVTLAIGIEKDHAKCHENGMKVEYDVFVKAKSANLHHPTCGKNDQNESQHLDED